MDKTSRLTAHISTHSLLILAVALLGSFTFQQAHAGFCGNYVQTSSNAGACANCRIQIADNPKLQKYFVTSSNGWSAELTWVEGDDSVAQGTGRWNRSISPPYGGKRFDIDMSEQGNILSMRMTVSDGSVPGTVRVTYLCLDPHRQGGNNQPAPQPTPLPSPQPTPYPNTQPYPNPPEREFSARSWGGVVRDGPGMQYRRLGSLSEGEPVHILENSGVMMNGYPWFRIRYRRNRYGYQWGGIMCATDYVRPGLHRMCR